MDPLFSISIVLASLIIILASYYSYKISGKLLQGETYNRNNAISLLYLNRAEDWNAFREADATWTPDLRESNLENVELSGINLRRVKLDGASWRNCNLDDADLTEASLINADFTGTSFKAAILDYANLEKARLDGSDFSEASFEGALLKGTVIEKTFQNHELKSFSDDPIKILEYLKHNPDAIYRISPRKLEEVVAELLIQQGFEVKLNLRSGDGNVDLIATQDSYIGSDAYIVEVKKYSKERLVGLKTVRALLGVVELRNATKGILVTSSYFTNSAKQYADSNEKLELIDFDGIADWLRKAPSPGHYHHNFIWNYIDKSKDVRILTSALCMPESNDCKSEHDDRINIDMWEYRAVLDLNHYFATNYSEVITIIEHPLIKLNKQGIESYNRLAKNITHMQRMLGNSNCIIVGSPEVNDYAEIAMSMLHGIDPYSVDRKKKKGFVFIKERLDTISSFYRLSKKGELEGVRQIEGSKDYRFYQNLFFQDNNRSRGITYGILVFMDNPFCSKGQRYKIIILSGFNGLATYALAEALTNQLHFEKIYGWGKEYLNTAQKLEVLIKVEYTTSINLDNIVKRHIDSINFVQLIPI